MGTIEIVDLSSDDEGGNVGPKAVKLDSVFDSGAKQQNETNKGQLAKHRRSQSHSVRQDSEENTSSSGPSTCHNYSGVLEQGLLPVDAIAELLDNAVDEVDPKWASFVVVDKTSNPKDRSPALLIQDDGGGMGPEAMHRCMSFGFSDKKSKFAVGQYGNGFKTGSMRLGADVIVFSCHLNNRILTQSVGLLSYTFLMRTQLDRIVVPMVNYEFNTSTGSLKIQNGQEHFPFNLSMLLHWSPYSSEK